MTTRGRCGRQPSPRTRSGPHTAVQTVRDRADTIEKYKDNIVALNESGTASMDADGVTAGFDLRMLDDVRREVSVPLIASGGAGRPEDFADAADHGADAVLAASVFHYGVLTIGAVKQALRRAGHPVR